MVHKYRSLPIEKTLSFIEAKSSDMLAVHMITCEHLAFDSRHRLQSTYTQEGRCTILQIFPTNICTSSDHPLWMHQFTKSYTPWWFARRIQRFLIYPRPKDSKRDKQNGASRAKTRWSKPLNICIDPEAGFLISSYMYRYVSNHTSATGIPQH